MFILSLDAGYAVMELAENGEYLVANYEGGIPYKLRIGKRPQSVRIIPIGEIVINRYNHSLQAYLDNGGNVKEVLRLHKEKKRKIKPPYPPEWIYPSEKPVEYALSEISLADDPTYLKVAYIQFMGRITPVFSVDKVDDLYFYDLLRMKSAELLIKECEDCGKAFLAKTTAVRCSECREAGLGEKKKRDNIKNNPARQLVYKIKDRNKNGKRDMNLAYPLYYANLCYAIQTHTPESNECTPEFLQFAKELDRLDKLYFKLCKFFDADCFDETLIQQWNAEKSKFPANIEETDKWIEEWCKEANFQ